LLYSSVNEENLKGELVRQRRKWFKKRIGRKIKCVFLRRGVHVKFRKAEYTWQAECISWV